MVATVPRISIFRRMGIDLGKIRALREKLKLSQEAAAKAAGFRGRQKWGDYELGRRVPKLETLERIASALGVDAADLLVKPKGKAK